MEFAPPRPVTWTVLLVTTAHNWNDKNCQIFISNNGFSECSRLVTFNTAKKNKKSVVINDDENGDQEQKSVSFDDSESHVAP